MITRMWGERTGGENCRCPSGKALNVKSLGSRLIDPIGREKARGTHLCRHTASTQSRARHRESSRYDSLDGLYRAITWDRAMGIPVKGGGEPHLGREKRTSYGVINFGPMAGHKTPRKLIWGRWTSGGGCAKMSQKGARNIDLVERSGGWRSLIVVAVGMRFGSI